MLGVHLLPADPQLIQRTDAIVGNKDVCACQQLVHDRLALRVLQVQGQRLFVGVDEFGVRVIQLIRPHAQHFAGIAPCLALQGLDLDYLGAPVCKHLTGSRSGAVGAEIDHADTFQRLMETHDSTTPFL